MEVDFKYALDTPWNAVFGIFCCFWGVLMVESWKKTQKILQHLWDCSDSSFSPIDERNEDFRFYKVFNEMTRQMDKTRMKLPKM